MALSQLNPSSPRVDRLVRTGHLLESLLVAALASSSLTSLLSEVVLESGEVVPFPENDKAPLSES